MHTVLVIGLVLTPLHAMAVVIAGKRRVDPEDLARAGRGWRAWYFMDRVQRVYWRLGLVAGVVCVIVGGVAALVGR